MEATIKDILMRRDGMTEKKAESLIEDARRDLHKRLANGEMPHDICSKWFGLESDFIIDLI